MFAGLEVLGDENADFDLVGADLFVACAVDVEAVEASGCCCVVE
jgi:hypothetical protein